MNRSATSARGAGAARIALLAWFGVNLVGLMGDYAGSAFRPGRPVTPAVALLLAIPAATLYTGVVVAAFRLARGHPLGQGRRLHAAAIHLAALGAALGGVQLVRAGTRALLAAHSAAFEPARDGAWLIAMAQLYAVLTGAAHAVEYARRFRQKEISELRLRTGLAEAELQRTSAELRMLKMQLNPHFLFNSLHAVSSLIDPQPRDAQRVLVRLSELLRRAMHSVATHEVALEEEIAGLRPFVEIEQLRFGGKLRVEWQIEEEALDAQVPHMVLQPLLENAIKHGLAPRAGAGCIQVRARRQGGELVLEVQDDGAGPSAAGEPDPARTGVGAANTRLRLRQLYGDRQSFVLAPAEGGGALATLRIPWHETPLHDAAPTPPPGADTTLTETA